MSQVAIHLSAEQIRSIVDDARKEVVHLLITQFKREGDFISQAQAGGILDLSYKSLAAIPDKDLPRYNLSPTGGKQIRYRLSEVLAYAQASRE